MAKRTLTEEQKEVLRERLAKARAAKQNKNPQTQNEHTTQTEQQPIKPAPETDGSAKVTIAHDELDELRAQIEELKAGPWAMLSQMMRNGQSNASVEDGKITGTVEKYSLDPSRYDDPRERLAKEERLKRFAFDINYELDFEISQSAYTTIDGIRTKEPKFTLTLIGIDFDDAGIDSGGRYDICRLILHEDPDTALSVARDEGLNVDTMEEKVFLNEMRYIRMRDWLISVFYPTPMTQGKQKRDVVVGGKLVQYWTKDTEDGKPGITKVDWDNLPKVRF